MQNARVLIGTAELAQVLKMHRQTLDRLVLQGVVQPDDYVTHGRIRRPLFDPGRLEAHRASIKKYRSRKRLSPF